MIIKAAKNLDSSYYIPILVLAVILMRHFLIIATFLFASTKTFAYNPFWAHKDKELIATLIKLDKNNPHEIEQYFKRNYHQPVQTAGQTGYLTIRFIINCSFF